MVNKIFIFLLFKYSLNMMIFPFKQAPENKNGDITIDSPKYNGTHFAIDNFNTKLYTEIKIGNPYQKVKVLLAAEECAFKIGKSKKCIYSDEYLSYYNRNKSNDFTYTPVHTMTDMDFNYEQGSTAEDTIYAYTDMNLQNEIPFKNVGFYLGSDTNDKLCGIIGLEMDNIVCQRIYNIVKDCKNKKYINNYNFILKYNSLNEGLFIIGSEFKDVIDNYDENKTFTAQMTSRVGVYRYGFDISKIILSGTKKVTMDTDVSGEIYNDNYFIVAGAKHLKSYRDAFFEEYLGKKICFINKYDNNPELTMSEKYSIIECNKGKFGDNDFKKFPNFEMYLGNYFEEKKFVFDYKDLFTETKYKYFFNIIFEDINRTKFELGKIFLKKYPINFNFENNKKVIEIYDVLFQYPDYNTEEEGKNEKSNVALYIIIIIVLIGITGVLGYYLGKYLNKMRKKRANELTDDFDYKPEFSIEPESENAINS